MKKIIYKLEGFTEVYNPKTEKCEKKKILIVVAAEYSENNLEIAKKEAYNGEYTIEDVE